MGKVDGLMELVDRIRIAAYNDGHRRAQNGVAAHNSFALQVKDLSAELRASLSTCVAEWRPISEAPRDGSFFLALSASGDMAVKNWPENCCEPGEWKENRPGEWGGAVDWTPTHYQPLPPPLTAETETEGETK